MRLECRYCGARSQSSGGGEVSAGDVLVPVPHRHSILALPKMLRPYFKFHRALLKDLCRIAHHCLTDYFQERGSGSRGSGPRRCHGDSHIR